MIENEIPEIKGYELLSQKVYRIMKELIINDKLKPGTQIKEKEMAKKLGVSITPVREAFRKLSSEGFIDTFPNRKSIIRKLSTDDISNSLYIRELLEGLAARLAAPNLNQSDVKQLAHYLHKMKEATLIKDINNYLNNYGNFQKTILVKCKNKLLQQMINNLSEISRYYNVRSLEVEGRFEKSFCEHVQIFNALKENNPRKAEELSRNHIRKVLENIISNNR